MDHFTPLLCSARFLLRRAIEALTYWLTCSFLWHSHFLLGLAQVHGTCRCWVVRDSDVFLGALNSQLESDNVHFYRWIEITVSCRASRRWLTSQQKNTHVQMTRDLLIKLTLSDPHSSLSLLHRSAFRWCRQTAQREWGTQKNNIAFLPIPLSQLKYILKRENSNTHSRHHGEYTHVVSESMLFMLCDPSPALLKYI